MEYFYRVMRKKYQILMDRDDPVGGAWNYDAENRKPPKQGLGQFPHPITIRPLMALPTMFCRWLRKILMIILAI